MKITAVRPKIPRRPAKPGLNAGRIQRLGPIGKPVSPRCIPARATARATCTSPSHNRTIATVKMTAPTVSRAIRTSGAAPAVGLGAGKFVGIVRCPTPHLSQFPNESVPIRTVSLAGFGNRVPSGILPFLRFECLTSAARCGRTSYSAYGQLGETSNRGGCSGLPRTRKAWDRPSALMFAR